MVLFACDLDKTLIYSYKHAPPGNICVEARGLKKLSYMTPAAHDMLQRLARRMVFVPVTTRSLEQYRRVNLLRGGPPRYALTTNGGILLINGAPDHDWFDRSLDLISDALPELVRGIDLLSSCALPDFPPRMVDRLFAFAKCRNPDDSVNLLSKYLNLKKVSIVTIGEKVYIIPNVLNKGDALARLKEKLSPDLVISAGDSALDLPMAKHSDIALYSLGNGRRNEMHFSELLLTILSELNIIT